jgi:ankyrin repeat protein
MNIFEAVQVGNNQRIIELLDSGINVNIRYKNGSTPLMFAIQQSNSSSSLETVKLLLDRGADINAKNNSGNNVLSFLVQYANTPESLNLLKSFLEKGVNINEKNNVGITPLMYAASYSNQEGSLDAVKLLLDNGANVNAKDNNGYTALMFSYKYSGDTSSIDTMKLLLAYGANPLDIDCQTVACDKLLAPYIWKKLYSRDKQLASKYSNEGEVKLPKDVWEIILLNKRQQLLCENLNHSRNREVLILFALELGINVTDSLTKGQLCGLISRQLAYGKYSNKSQQEIDTFKKDILRMAKKFNIDTNRPFEEIVKKLGKMF